MKIGITGAAGFIGEKILDRLISLGFDVRVLSRLSQRSNYLNKKAEVSIGDLTNNNQQLSDFVNGLDVLIHCAAEIRDEEKMYQTNVLGTINLISCAKNKVKHWIQLSSTGVYGPCFEGIINENTPYNANNTYESTKLEADLLVIKAGENKHFEYTIIRPSNVYGPTMKNQSLFQLISTIDKGRFFFIGEKKAIVNYIHVDNVVDLIVLSISNLPAKNEIFNISDNLNIEEFVFEIRTVLDKKMIHFRLPKNVVFAINSVITIFFKTPLTPARINHLTNRAAYSNGKTILKLKYQNRISIQEGIRELTEFYKKTKI